jgi:DNA-binding IclR family transcriptional regulator
MRFLQIGGRWRADSKVFRIAEPEVRDLATKTGEHANLMIEEGGLGVFLLKQKGDRSVTLDTYEGMHVYLHTTALGKAILSVVDETGLDEILSTHGLPELTGNTITDESDLREELATVRERGYALDDAERINDVRCVAAPILSDEPDVLAAISISAPKNRMRGEYFNETIPEEVLKTANIINVNYRHD